MRKSPPTSSASGQTPMIEVNVTHERGSAPSLSRLTEAVEVITRNHVYVLDAGLTCISVLDASSREQVTESGFLDSRLVGGQFNTDDSTEISYPFPRPGAVAVFETIKGRARQFHHTSPVHRVVLRLSILTVTTNRVTPTWEEISRVTHPVD